jgi:hypothetical protein
VEDPFQPHRLAVLLAEGHHVSNSHLAAVAESDAVGAVLVGELHRDLLHPQVLPDERPQRLHRPAELAAEHGAELLGLLIGRLLVHQNAEPPVPLAHHLWRVGDCSDGQAADVHALDLSRLDLEDEHRVAPVVVSADIEGNRAGAGHLARAVLEVGALDAPSHGVSLWSVR